MNGNTLFATLTCPNPACQHQQRALIPEHACQLTYLCEGCLLTHRRKAGDCCVFCSYADRPCPSKGEEDPRSACCDRPEEIEDPCIAMIVHDEPERQRKEIHEPLVT
jgi:hypothetical protein